MRPKLFFFISALIVCTVALSAFQKDKESESWSKNQLMPSAELAEKLNKNADNLVVLNIGPSGKIKNSITIGATQEKANMDALKMKLATLPKNAEIVIYCGCCPFEHCPNIRPAFELAKEMNFVNAKLLNLPKNLKVDWIDKGYPMQN